MTPHPDARIIPHEPRWPGGSPKDLDHSDAERVNRQAVTAAWLWDHPDVTAWFLLTGVTEQWIEITGVDMLNKCGSIVLEYGRTAERVVAPSFEVYVHKRYAGYIIMEDADHD